MSGRQKTSGNTGAKRSAVELEEGAHSVVQDGGPLNLLIDVATLPKRGFDYSFKATDEERRAVAAFLGLESVQSLSASFELLRWKSKGVHIAGTLSANVEQACVLTLEPVAERIKHAVDLLFVPEGSKLAKPQFDLNGEMILPSDGADAPDTFGNNQIQLGDVLIEQLSLALDPYPRAPDAEMPLMPEEAPDEPAPSAFEALKNFKVTEKPE